MVSGLVFFAILMLGPAAAAVLAVRGAQLNTAIGVGAVSAVVVAVAMLALNLGNADSGRFLAVVAAVTLGVVSFGLASVAALTAFALRGRD